MSDVRKIKYLETDEGCWIQSLKNPPRLFKGKDLDGIKFLLDISVGKGKYTLEHDEHLDENINPIAEQ